MEEKIEKWIRRCVAGVIALCVLFVFGVYPIAAILGLIGIFITEAAIEKVKKEQ